MFISDADRVRRFSRRARHAPNRIAATRALDRVLAIGIGAVIGGLSLAAVLALRLALALRAWPAGQDLLHGWLPVLF